MVIWGAKLKWQALIAKSECIRWKQTITYGKACENHNPHCSIEAVNRSEWMVEKWSVWRESNPLCDQNPNSLSSETMKIPSSLPILNESHTVLVNWVDAGEDECCDSTHTTTSPTAIVVSRRCFNSLQLSIVQLSWRAVLRTALVPIEKLRKRQGLPHSKRMLPRSTQFLWQIGRRFCQALGQVADSALT